MIDGIAASSSIAVPSGRLSHAGESSVRKSAMPKPPGTAISIAIAEVTSVPTIGTSAPKLSCTGSQSACQRNDGPYFCRLAELPRTSETRIAARMLNTSSAKKRVSHSNAVSFQRAGPRRAGSILKGWPTAIPKDAISVNRLARRILELRFPRRLDQLHHRVGDRHVVELGGDLLSVSECPVEELEHLFCVL